MLSAKHKTRAQHKTTMSARFLLSLLVLSVACAAPALALVCSVEQTEAYLAEGTSHTFTRKQLDYVIVIDRSGSMQGAKLDTVKRAAQSLINELGPGDRAAIISFNYEATTDQALTSNTAQLTQAIEGIRASFGTQYTPALRLSQRELSDLSRDRALIFLSDGKGDFTETPEEIGSLTSVIARQGVCIMTISYALDGEESTQLEAMSSIGKDLGCGEHYEASERGTELEEVFTAIRDRLTSTDVITITPTFIGNTYSFSFASKLNENPLPGESPLGCVEEPDFRIEFSRAGRVLATATTREGTIQLPPGAYGYSARAAVRCGGACSFSGVDNGVITIGDGCNPSYAQLSSYVLGENGQIRITPAGFSPQTIRATQGSTIVWNNTDIKPRTITSAFFNVTIQPGELYAYKVRSVGTLLFVDPELGATNSVETVAGTGSDVLLVFDESGSMRGAPLEEGRIAAQQFFQALGPSDRGGLVTFSQGARLVQDFTSDKERLVSATSALRSGGATSYLAALEMVETLRPVQSPILVFMSDGEPTDEAGRDAIYAAADRLRAKGWCIMTVGFGEGGARARNTLAQLAGNDACAAFVYAADGQLATAFGTVHQLLAQQNDLVIDRLRISPLVFGSEAAIRTRVETRSGRPVPGGTNICAPEAVVRATTTTSTAALDYEEGWYTGTLAVPYGRVRITVAATTTSVEALNQPFVGRESVTIYAIPEWVGWSFLGLLFFLTGVFFTLRYHRRKELTKNSDTKETRPAKNTQQDAQQKAQQKEQREEP